MPKRKGNQFPTISVVLPYDKDKSFGKSAVANYNLTGRTAQEWQERLLYDIESVNEDGLWTHTKFGYSVPRRNGKNEIVAMRELDGLNRGERILHTAHRTTTSHSAALRLAKLLDDMGYQEVIRVKKGEAYSKHYVFSKQFGLEKIRLLDGMGGVCDFRTRTSHGGLGEGFDTLIIDEAQEYTDEQESTLKYVVTDSQNPQTIMCGTPPTSVSIGTVFQEYRDKVLAGSVANGGWAEWSVDEMTDPHDVEAWYRCNPSLGTIFTERSINDEIGSDDVDFNIQRFGLWLKKNQKSAIDESDWLKCKVDELPELKHELYVGIKFGNDGTNVSLSIAAKCVDDDRVFIEVIDCREIRQGVAWIISFLRSCKSLKGVCIDGVQGQKILSDAMKSEKLKKPILPTVKEVINANAMFDDAIYQQKVCHKNQPSLTQVVTNCDRRTIGTNGGFGFRSLLSDVDVVLMDSCILAFWLASVSKDNTKQKIRY